jgi:hypothetical protein
LNPETRPWRLQVSASLGPPRKRQALGAATSPNSVRPKTTNRCLVCPRYPGSRLHTDL